MTQSPAAAALTAAAARRDTDLQAENERLTAQLADLLEGKPCRWSDCALTQAQHEHRRRGGFTGGV